MPATRRRTRSRTCWPARKWDHDGVRDDLRDYVVGHLGADEAVLVLDETGDLKKGTGTVATQSQYTGTAGRIENAQVAVYAVWATPRGHGFVDRALYVPESWTADPQRCQAAGLPEDLQFATKPELALNIVQRVTAAGARPGFVAADEVYGNAGEFRAGLERLGLGYVLAVSCSTTITFGPARAPRACGCISGHTCTWTNPPRSAGSATCSSGAPSAAARCPTTAAGPRNRPDFATWSPWPARDGRSRNLSKPERAQQGSSSFIAHCHRRRFYL
jgi:hypothetical protein